MRALYLLLEAMLLFVTVLFVLEYKERLIEKMLHRQGIDMEVAFVDLHCLEAKDIRYQKLPIAKELLACIRYNPLLQGRIELSEAIVKDLDLNSLQKIVQKSTKKSSQGSIPFTIDRLYVSTIYRYKGFNKATLIASDVSPKKATIQKLLIKSFAANVQAKGSYDKTLALQGTLQPKPAFVQKAIPAINPKAIKKATFTLELNTTTLRYTLMAKATALLKDLNASLQSRGSYAFKSKTYKSQNRLALDYNKTRVTSDCNLTYRRTLTYSATGTAVSEAYLLPIKPSFYKTLNFSGKGDLHELRASLRSSHLHATIEAKEWKRFNVQTNPILLGDLFDLPPQLQHKRFWLQALYDEKLDAKIYSDLGEAILLYEKETLEATIRPKDFATFHLSSLAPITIKANLAKKAATATSPLFQAKADFSKGFTSSISIAQSRLKLRYDRNLTLNATIPSIGNLAQAVSKIYPVDIQDIDATLSLNAAYHPKTKHYSFHLRSPKVKKGISRVQYLELKGHGIHKRLWIDYYALALSDHAFYATKPSHILFEDGITIDRFWIEDALLLQGHYREGNGAFRLKSDRYHYSSIEGALDTKVDLNATIEQKRVNVEGNVLLLQGDLSFTPKRTKNVEDPDIIVVDAPKKEAPPFFKENVALNIKVDAKKPIRYHIPDLEVHFRPDLLLWKEFGKDLELLGYVNIIKGSYKPLGEEYFITKSSLYFSSTPTNPFLEIHIKTNKESYTIYITVSGTLANPMLTFDSDPYLPQKDILAMLLFGSKSSNLLFKAVGGNQLAGALGSMFLKNMLSEIGISLDTLTFSAGSRFGFEIGKRISDKITVLYKNDQVSTIIIRYQVGDHFESEAIFGPLKSGINLFYRRVR